MTPARRPSRSPRASTAPAAIPRQPEPVGRPLHALMVMGPEATGQVTRRLRKAGWAVTSERATTVEAMAAVLDRQPWDLVLADDALPRFAVAPALQLLQRHGLDVPFIIVSGTGGEETAVAAMKAGAHDYLTRDNLARLGPVVEREVRDALARRQRSQAQQQLARERDFSRMLVEGANALVVGFDSQGIVTLFNRAAEAITGFRREDLLGRDWFDLVVPRARYPEVWARYLALRTATVPHDVEHPILIASGEERIVSWRSSVLRSGAEIAGFVSFGIDVTERQRDAQRRSALEQLARRADKLAALGALAAGLAHELNNPIGIISSRIELMLMEHDGDALPTAVREDLAVLRRHAQRVARITQGLLTFARQSSDERLPVDLNYIVEETLLLAERQMTKAGIQVATTLDTALPPVLGDSSTLQQVLLNLIKNAWDAVEAGGQIRIATRAPRDRPDRVELTVADTGRGILPHDIPRIFDPFFSTKPTGTGLGLSITEGIVRDHGGTIDVESTPGKGTRFVLTFPSLSGLRQPAQPSSPDGGVGIG